MLAYWLSGRRSRALEVYAQFRAAVAELLGDEPSEVSQQLYLTILQSQPATSHAASSYDHMSRLSALLLLLRQELEITPGVRAPALDAELSVVAAQALARTPG